MKNWIASLKRKLGRHLIVPVMAIAMVGSVVTYDIMKAMPAKAAAAMASPTTTPLDNDSVGALLSLDRAMETLAARVTPAIVNVTVTSRAKVNVSGGDAEDMQGSFLTAIRWPSIRRPGWPAIQSLRSLLWAANEAPAATAG